MAERWRAEVAHYLPLIARVIAQSVRRVLNGEAVPAGEKLVSLFEPHADILLKGGRQVQYGHKPPKANFWAAQQVVKPSRCLHPVETRRLFGSADD